jgi:hypothetical protein
MIDCKKICTKYEKKKKKISQKKTKKVCFHYGGLAKEIDKKYTR